MSTNNNKRSNNSSNANNNANNKQQAHNGRRSQGGHRVSVKQSGQIPTNQQAQRYGNKSPQTAPSPFRRGGVFKPAFRRPHNQRVGANMTNNSEDDDGDQTVEEEEEEDGMAVRAFHRNNNNNNNNNEHQQNRKKRQQQQQAHTTLPFQNILPQDVCTQHHVPAHATFSLTSIQSLSQYIPPGSIVIFDIDDTLIKREFNNTSLLTQHGTNMFHNYLQSEACQHMSYEEKQKLVNTLGNALKAFVPAESDTVQIVRTLQSRNCYVFALTARSSTMSTATTTCLNAMGIDFRGSKPPTLPNQSIDPQTGAAVIDGIIYCNDVPKGIVFQRMLGTQWITYPIVHHCSQHSCGQPQGCPENNKVIACTQTQTSHNKNEPCPERTVWFIDDSLPMLSSMLHSWQQAAQQRVEFFSNLQQNIQQQMPCQGKAALVCCHYTHPTNYTLNPSANPCALNPQDVDRVIALQIHSFINRGTLLTDQQALEMLGGMPDVVAAQQQQQQQQQ